MPRISVPHSDFERKDETDLTDNEFDKREYTVGDSAADMPVGSDTVDVIGVSFRDSGKIYHFASCGITAREGKKVVVETARGVEYGTVTMSNRAIPKNELVLPLKKILRMATHEDDLHFEDNRKKEDEAFSVCQKMIAEHGLDMKLIDVEYTFDNAKLLFYFTSDDRVDFRELVKDLAAVFHTRIELRQIGIRDETKIMGGLGVCYREYCCHSFLNDFTQVSIKMAKEQGLSLNSSKISGACGRLMCCLRFEHETYQEEIKRTPKVGVAIVTPDGTGMVVESKPLLGLVKVCLDADPEGAPKIYDRDAVRAKTDDDPITKRIEKAERAARPVNVPFVGSGVTVVSACDEEERETSEPERMSSRRFAEKQGIKGQKQKKQANVQRSERTAETAEQKKTTEVKEPADKKKKNGSGRKGQYGTKNPQTKQERAVAQRSETAADEKGRRDKQRRAVAVQRSDVREDRAAADGEIKKADGGKKEHNFAKHGKNRNPNRKSGEKSGEIK